MLIYINIFQATLSIGWTTKFNSASDPSGEYTMDMALKMAERLTENSVGQPITFPIRAAFVGKSLKALEYLIDNVSFFIFFKILCIL